MIFKLKNIKEFRSNTLGINQRNLNYVSKYNNRKHYRLADDKSLTKRILEKHNISCPKTYGLVDKVGEIASVWKQVNHYQHLVIKPASGRGGGGILILHKKDNVWCKSNKPISVDYIYTHIANIIFGIYSIGDQDKAIIEECIFTHEFFRTIYDNGVPDLRLIMLENELVMGMLRYPTLESDGKANLHQGGLGIGVDLSSGKLMEAHDGKNYITHHPDSGVQIVGETIPFWNQIIKLAYQTSHAFPLEFLGVDIIIDQDKGPIVMEVNVRPGLGIQLANKRGLLTDLYKIENK